jgi:hypothetical protein
MFRSIYLWKSKKYKLALKLVLVRYDWEIESSLLKSGKHLYKFE